MSRNTRLAQRQFPVWLLLSSALGLALAYIAWLRRELASARDRGDMYRDIAASLDQGQNRA